MEGKRPHAQYCTRSCKSVDGSARAAVRNPDLNKQRYLREKERRKAYAREKYWEDPQKSIEYSRTWRRENPHRRRVQGERRARLMRENPGFVPFGNDEWIRMKNRHGGKCFYCGDVALLTMDHVIPLARGGRHAIANIVPACKPCNSSKHDSLLVEWRQRPVRR